MKMTSSYDGRKGHNATTSGLGFNKHHSQSKANARIVDWTHNYYFLLWWKGHDEQRHTRVLTNTIHNQKQIQMVDWFGASSTHTFYYQNDFLLWWKGHSTQHHARVLTNTVHNQQQIAYGRLKPPQVMAAGMIKMTFCCYGKDVHNTKRLPIR